MSIRVTGNLNPFKGASNRLRGNVENALRRGGALLVRTSRSRAPFKTGLLRRSINYVVKGLKLIFGSGVRGLQCFYLRHQEEGTRYMRPKRFMKSSVSDKLPQIKQWLRQAVGKSI